MSDLTIGGLEPESTFGPGGVGRAGIVLVSADADDEQSSGLAKALSDEGFMLISLDVDPAPVTEPTSFQAFEALVDSLRRWWPDDAIGVVGLGGGGWFAFEVARRMQLGAAVTMWPTDDWRLEPEAGQRTVLETPWLGLVRGESDVIGDAGWPIRASGAVHHELVVQRPAAPGVVEDLAPDRDGPSFEAWQRALEWFEKRLPPRRVHLPYLADDAAAQSLAPRSE